MSAPVPVYLQLEELSDDEIDEAAGLVADLGGDPRERFDHGGAAAELWPYVVLGVLSLRTLLDSAVAQSGDVAAETRMVRLLTLMKPRRPGRKVVESQQTGPSFVFNEDVLLPEAVHAMFHDRTLYTDDLDGRALYWHPVSRRWRPEPSTEKAPGGGSAARCAVLVLTAIEVEHAAVLEQLVDVERTVHPTGTPLWIGRFGRSNLRVGLAMVGTGSVSAAILTERLLAHARPRLTLVVGVAGRLHTDLALGDLVVATKVHAYQQGRETETGFRSRPASWPAPVRYESVAREIARRPEWAGEVYFRALAVGDVVLDSPDGPLVSRIRQELDDAAAIEMESWGIWHAAHFNEHPVLTIRGISDLADGQKSRADSAGWQRRASEKAGRFAADLCGELARRPPWTEK